MSKLKVCIALLGVGLVLGLTACGGSSGSSSSSESEPAASGDSGAAAEGETTSSGGGAAEGEPIKVGMAIAESGPISPYDIPAAEAAKLAAEEINAEGGINGQPIELIVKDTRSDKAEGSNAATELVGEGISALIVSCDFDYGSPAAIVGDAAEIPSISMCASATKFADKKTLGEYAFSLGVGADVEGSSNAEWAMDKKGWKSVYILQDQSIEFTKSDGAYFRGRWKELGGKVAGEDSFPGGENVNVNAQAAKIKSSGSEADFIYIPTWNPGGATAIRQLRAAGITTPILAPAAIDSSALTEIAGPASEVFFTAYGCFAYCKGQKSKGQEEFVAAYTKKTGSPPESSIDVLGYDTVLALGKGMEEASEISGPAIREALEHMPEIETPTGPLQIFSDTCHKPINAPLDYVELQNGEYSYVETFQAKQLAKIGEGNPCVGE